MKMPRKIPGATVDLHYTEKRQKNNDAVKKSREKTRQKAKETMDKVSQLKQVRNMFLWNIPTTFAQQRFLFQENEMLEERIKLLAKELTFLKDVSLVTEFNHILRFQFFPIPT